MSESRPATPATPRRRNWLKILGIIVGVFVLLLVGAYLVLTSSAFFKGVILPKVGQGVNASITVSDASISPFSQVVLSNLKVQTTGNEPLLKADEVRLRYSLPAILKGNLRIELVSITRPAITVVTNADGSSNLDPLMKEQKKTEPAKPKAGSEKSATIDLGKLAITDASLRIITDHGPNHKPDLVEISGLNFTLENLKNGGTGSGKLAAAFNLQQNPPGKEGGAVTGRADGDFRFSLSSYLKPTMIEAGTKLAVTSAAGTLAQASGFSANLNANLTAEEIKELALRFQKGGQPLGELLVSGPFNLDRSEGNLSVRLTGVDNKLLNIATAGSDLQFPSGAITSTNAVQLAAGGKNLTVIGEVGLANLAITRSNRTSTPLSLTAAYNLHLDGTASNLVLSRFDVAGTQGGRQVISGKLDKPMTLAWGSPRGDSGEAALKLDVADFALADWKPFLADVAPEGNVQASLQVLSRNAGKSLDVSLQSELNRLVVQAGTNRVPDLGATLRLFVHGSDLNAWSITNLDLALNHGRDTVLRASGKGQYDSKARSGSVALLSELQLANNVAGLAASTNLHLVSGLVNTSSKIDINAGNYSIGQSLAVTNLTGEAAGTPFGNMGLAMNLDLLVNTQMVATIQRGEGRLFQAGQPGGSFDLSGSLSTNTGHVDLTLNEVNQDFLRPMLQNYLNGKQLASVRVSAKSSTRYSLPDGTPGKGVTTAPMIVLATNNFSISNLVISDPAKSAPAPLELQMSLLSLMTNSVINLSNSTVRLSPTPSATNLVSIDGYLDLTDTNARTGTLTVHSPGIDLTRFYDMFEPAPSETKVTPKTTASAPATAPIATTNAPAAWGVSNLVVQARIDKLLLREVQISNLVTTVRIGEKQVLLNPFKLALNGAPVSFNTELDLTKPEAMKYQVAFNATQVPLAPLANSFAPDRRGQLGGTFTADAQVKGIGTSGASLQKNLSGYFDMGSTNLNLSVVNVKSPVLRSLINVVGLIPDLIKSPEAALGSMLSSFTSGGKGGLSDDLARSPLDVITATGKIGEGQITLSNAVVRSPAFVARANGVVGLAAEYTNSTLQIPLNIALSRGIAERLKLLPAGTPTNVAYIDLPQFVTMRGTVGEPKTDINKLVLAKFAAETLAGSKLGGQAGGVLGGLLGGSKTNAPGTNQTTTGALLQGLGGLLGGGSKTNTTGTTNTTPATNQVPNLLNNLFNPRKQ